MYKEILHNDKEIGGVWSTIRGDIQSIDKIEIQPEYRNKGDARAAMQDIVNDADVKGIALALTPEILKEEMSKNVKIKKHREGI